MLMEINVPQKDFAHRVQEWVQENKTFLVLILIAGVGFFGILIGTSSWFESKDTRGHEALYEAKEEKESLQKVASDFPKSEAALWSLVKLAKMAQKEKDSDTCIRNFEEAYTRSRQSFFRVLALHGKAICLRDQGQFKEAASVFERASKEPGHVDPLVSLFEEARSYHLGGDSLAMEKYETLLRKEGLSKELKDKIEEQLLWLRLKGKS